MRTLRAHDLVHLADAAWAPPGAPLWVRDALKRTPWAVVRREAPHAPGVVSVGVRGLSRSQRFALDYPASAVVDALTPEDLSSRTADIAGRPAMRALHSLRTPLKHLGLIWGPTGSVGFELATGARTVSLTSDLDLVVRASPMLLPRCLGRVQELITLAPASVDCVVETPFGAVTLAELLSGGEQVLAKTATGPRLVATRDVLS